LSKKIKQVQTPKKKKNKTTALFPRGFFLACPEGGGL